MCCLVFLRDRFKDVGWLHQFLSLEVGEAYSVIRVEGSGGGGWFGFLDFFVGVFERKKYGRTRQGERERERQDGGGKPWTERGTGFQFSRLFICRAPKTTNLLLSFC